jgi:glycerophosphoryl diester phosphodiesterase
VSGERDTTAAAKRLLKSETNRVLVEAHRGADAIAPQNSWTAILAGAEAGADWIEVDVQITADDVPVLYHPYRLPGGGFVRATPYAFMESVDMGDGRPPARLVEVLDWLNGQSVGMTLDVKSGFGAGVAVFQAVLEAARRTNSQSRLMIGGWDHIGLLWTKRHEPALRTRAFLRGSPVDLVGMVKRAEVDAVSLSYDLIDRSDVEALHEAGVAVVLTEMWEPNFRYPVELGVDMISWGDPAEAIYALEMQGAR